MRVVVVASAGWLGLACGGLACWVGNLVFVEFSARACRSRRWLAVATLGAPLLAGVVACGARSGPGSEPQPTITLTDKPVPQSEIDKRGELARNALLEESEIPLKVPYSSNEVDSVGRRIQHACNATVESDHGIVEENGHSWKGGQGNPMVDQAVLVYRSDLAAVAVVEAEAALNCSSYSTRDEQIQVGGMFDSVRIASGESRAFGFCEAVGPKPVVERCTLIAGAGRVACEVRAWAKERDVARSTIEALSGVVRRRCSSLG